MNILDLTLPTPQENLACDEALMRIDDPGNGILRFWEPRSYFAVLGLSRRYMRDVNCDYCRDRNIPILRRISGGGTVLQGPGCLNFSLIFSLSGPHDLSTITGTNQYILKRHQRALETIVGGKIHIRGTSDLTLGEMKFSGNSQRREKGRLLFQGSFLARADIATMEKVLTLPDRQPAYRQNRPHGEFVVNLGIEPQKIKEAIAREWKATSTLKTIPINEIRKLAETKYSDDNWNLKF